ncbi:MAG: hypothetical protein R6V19_00350 [Armatimonadota bacterium]
MIRNSHALTALVCVAIFSLAQVAMGAPEAADTDPASQTADRTQMAREILQNTVSKFVFNQGHGFDRNRETGAIEFRPEVLDAYMEKISATGFNTYDYWRGWPWNEQKFELLEKVCEAAAEHDLDVWATLAPPTGVEDLRKMPEDQARQYYYDTVERFAEISLQHDNFVAFTCDDFSHNYDFFTPEVLAEMARRWRSINPRLLFLPLIYYPGVTEEFVETRGDYIDGIVFHYRAESYPPGYIDAYDPNSFEMYADVMRYEFERVRRILGDKPLIAGLYVWYYEGGWGVMTPDGEAPSTEHIVKDAVQKFKIAHEYALGTRIYGLGIDRPCYEAMGNLAQQWREEGDDWGDAPAEDPQRHIQKYRTELDNPPYFGTLLQRPSAVSRGLKDRLGVPQIDILSRLQDGTFDPEEAVDTYYCILVSRSSMRPEWADLLAEYAQLGGTLILEGVPGWYTATDGEALRGEQAPCTLKFGEVAGVEFHYYHRGAVNRIRIKSAHPLTEGLGPAGEWIDIPYERGGRQYGHLAYPAKAITADVLVEAEHQWARYNGVKYVRKQEVTGVHPLVTVREVNDGVVIRHFAHVSLPTVLGGERFSTFADNLAGWVQKLYHTGGIEAPKG